MIRLAQKYNNREDEVHFTKMYRCLIECGTAKRTIAKPAGTGASFFGKAGFTDKSIENN